MSEIRDPLVFLEDMLTSAEKIASYAQGTTPDELFKHQAIVDAIPYNLLVLGEAAKESHRRSGRLTRRYPGDPLPE